MTKYPLWQYPFIFIALANYVEIWRVRSLRSRIRSTIKGRKSMLGIDPTMTDTLSFGHWLVSMRFYQIWG